MSVVTCPYCKEDQEINHDEGQGYSEDSEHEQICPGCNKYFKFTTSITYSYEVLCQDNDHKMEPFGDEWPDMFECENCDFYEKRAHKEPS